MAIVSLKEFLETHTQTDAAKQLDVTQSAVSQMLTAERNVLISTDEDGNIDSACEVKWMGQR